jgi:ADP-heptose:LPS heptosyltransferase
MLHICRQTMSKGITRILVIRFSSIGDIVLTTPVLRALRQQLEGDVEIHYLTKKKFALLLEGNPNIDFLHTMDKTVQEVLPELERIGFDYIIDLHRNIRTKIVIRRLKSLTFAFRKLNFQKWLWVNLGINKMPELHIVDRYMETLKAFGVRDDGQGLDFYIPNGKGLRQGQIPESFQQNYIALAIGGMHEGKKMTADKLITICQSIPHNVLLIGGTEDEMEGEKIVNACGPKFYNACGKLSLHESADAISQSRMVITGDTGMMHIASAFQKKILSLWGCTVPGFGMYPYRPNPESILLEPIGRKRRPCSKLGNRCKYGLDHRCIDQIKNEEILKAIEKLWAQ